MSAAKGCWIFRLFDYVSLSQPMSFLSIYPWFCQFICIFIYLSAIDLGVSNILAIYQSLSNKCCQLILIKYNQPEEGTDQECIRCKQSTQARWFWHCPWTLPCHHQLWEWWTIGSKFHHPIQLWFQTNDDCDIETIFNVFRTFLKPNTLDLKPTWKDAFTLSPIRQ